MRARISSPRPHRRPRGSSSRVLTRHPSDDLMRIRRPVIILENGCRLNSTTSAVASLLETLDLQPAIFIGEEIKKRKKEKESILFFVIYLNKKEKNTIGGFGFGLTGLGFRFCGLKKRSLWASFCIYLNFRGKKNIFKLFLLPAAGSEYRIGPHFLFFW